MYIVRSILDLSWMQLIRGRSGPYLALTDAFGRIQTGPNASDEINKIPDAEPDLRPGPGLHSNLGPDFGSVQRPSGVRIGPGPDLATTSQQARNREGIY